MNNTTVKTTLIHTHVKTTRINHETAALSLTLACLHAVKGSVAMSLQMYANNMRDTLSLVPSTSLLKTSDFTTATPLFPAGLAKIGRAHV